MSQDGFLRELESLINRESRENGSNTPDFILAQFLVGCLAAWDTAVQQRETWYGRDPRPTAAPAAPEGGRPDPQLLQAAIDERDLRPWRYYKFDRDELKRGLDARVDEILRLKAQLAADAGRTALRALVRTWRARADEHDRDGERGRKYEVNVCADELAALLGLDEGPDQARA